MKSVMTRFAKSLISLLVITLATSATVFALDVTSPEKGRLVEESVYNNTSAVDLLSSHYSDLLSDHNSENSRKKELRLAMALKIFDATYNHITQASSSSSANGKRFLPSPAALLKIDAVLASIDNSSGNESDSEYIEAMRSRLNTLGTAAENELIRNVLEDMKNNEDTIKDLNAGNPSELLNQILNDDSNNNDGLTDNDDSENNVPEVTDIEVPDDSADRTGTDDSSYDDDNFAEDLQDTSTGNLTAADMAGWSDEELADRIAALTALADSGEANSNLAAMQQLQALRNEEKLNGQNTPESDTTESNDTVPGNVVPPTNTPDEAIPTGEGNDTSISLADERSQQIDSQMGPGGSLSLFDNALVNMTDFFHTDKDSEEDADQTGTGIYDPLTLKELSEEDVDSMGIIDNFDTELIQGGTDEAISERNISN